MPVGGIPIEIEVDTPTYPTPPLFTVIDWTVPAAETTAVREALSGFWDWSTIRTSKLTGESYSNKSTESTYKISSVDWISEIIPAFGKTNGSIWSLALSIIFPLITLSVFCLIHFKGR